MDHRRQAQQIVAEAELVILGQVGRRHRAVADVEMLIATYDEIVRVVGSRVQGL